MKISSLSFCSNQSKLIEKQQQLKEFARLTFNSSDSTDTKETIKQDLKTHRLTWFGLNQKPTDSIVYAKVIEFLNANKSSFLSCFDSKGKLDLAKFTQYLADNSDDTATMQNVSSRVLREITLVQDLSLIRFNSHYSISVYDLLPSNLNRAFVTSPKADDDIDMNMDDNIRNKTIRSEFSETEIIIAKEMAVDYFVDIANTKINSYSTNQKKKIVQQIIFFHKILNIAMRQLVSYKLGYHVLNELAKNIFEDLGIKTEQDKINFINQSVILNYHRNCGMKVKQALKAPVVGLWISLPFLSATGMLLLGITAAHELSTSLGALTISGNTVESLSDFINLAEHNSMLKKINCGDRLKSHTRSYLKVEQVLLGKLGGRINMNTYVPTNEQLLKLFNCYEEIDGANIEHIDRTVKQIMSDISRDSPKKTPDVRRADNLRLYEKLASQ